MEEKRNIPEDVLNLELKYLDENVRPYITLMVESWKKYMKKLEGGSANNIIIDIQALLFQLRPVQRLTIIELKGFESRNMILQKAAMGKDIKTFNRDIINLINDLTDKIGDCKLFARPSEDAVSGLASIMQDLKKN